MLARMMKLSPAIRQTLIYGLALGFSKGVGFVMVPVFTHYLEPADYGRLDVLQTLADLLGIVIGLGLADTLFRFAGKAKDEEDRRAIAANILGMALAVGLFSLVVTQLFAPLVADALPGDVSVAQTRLILGSLAVSGISMVSLALLRMRDRSGLYLLGSVGRVGLHAMLAFLLLSLGFGITGILAAGLAAAAVLAVALIVWQVRSIGLRFDFAQCRGYAVYGGPLVLTGMAGFVLGSFDRWILADAVGTAAMAEYALAAKFGLMTAILIQPFDMWWYPRRFAVLAEPDGAERSARIVGIGVSIAVLSAVTVAVAGPVMIRLMTPASYHGAIAYVPWMSALAAVHNVTTVFNIGCYSGRTTGWPVVIDGTAAAVAVAGYFLLIPVYGAWGAIAATTIALSLRLAMSYRISQRITPLPYPLKRLLALSAIGLLAITAMQMTDGEGLRLAMGALGLTTVGLAVLALRLVPVPVPAAR